MDMHQSSNQPPQRKSTKYVKVESRGETEVEIQVSGNEGKDRNEEKGSQKGTRNIEEHTGRYVTVNVSIDTNLSTMLCFTDRDINSSDGLRADDVSSSKTRSWIKCKRYGGWHHCLCAGLQIQKASVASFVCALCIS